MTSLNAFLLLLFIFKFIVAAIKLSTNNNNNNNNVYFDTALQLCPDPRVFLLQRRRPGPLATTIFVFSFLFLALGTYTPEGKK